jgi:tetratricopeptide repeat protein 21B
MGKMQYLRTHRRQLTPALDIASQIMVYYPTFVPAYIEKMYTLLEMSAWDQVVEAAQRLSGVVSDWIDTSAVLCLNELCREGRVKQAANQLASLFQVSFRYSP